MIEWIVGLIATSFGFALGGAGMRRAKAWNLARSGRYEIGIRVLSGEQSGLTSGWTHGVATANAGQILFSPSMNNRSKLRGSVVHIEPTSVESYAFRRKTGPEEALSVMPGSYRITVSTRTAELDVAVVGDVARFTSRLGLN